MEVAGQQPEQSTAPVEPVAPSVASTPTLSPTDLEKVIADLRKENASYRIKAKEERTEKEKLAAQQGEYKTAYELKQAEQAELQAKLKDAEAAFEKAKRWDEFEQSKLQEVEGVKASLPAYMQKALDAASTVQAKLEILSSYQAENQGRQKQQPGASVIPPAPQRDFAAGSLTPSDYSSASRNKDPAYLQFVRSFVPSKKGA